MSSAANSISAKATPITARLIDRAERRLKNLDFFKTVKITNEPGSAPDRVIVNVNVEEKSTGEFSVSGGYSTSQGLISEMSVAERNLMGRGQFAKASVPYGQYSRGFGLSFVEPYLLGYRMAGGIDLFANQNLANHTTSLQLRIDRRESAPWFCIDRRTVAAAALFDLPAEDHAAGNLNNCISSSDTAVGGTSSRISIRAMRR